MDRSNHYEAAFEAYLQWHRLCYVAVDETRRSLHDETRVKNLDFIVHGEAGWRLLVDVKGRRFPGTRGRRVWECWCERDDIEGLDRWEDLFGPGSLGLLVFTYDLAPSVSLPDDTLDLWTWRGRRYLFRAVPLADYREHLRVRSPKWSTVDLSAADFRRLARPLHEFLYGPAATPVAAEERPPDDVPF
jgi:hypothetical protein